MVIHVCLAVAAEQHRKIRVANRMTVLLSLQSKTVDVLTLGIMMKCEREPDSGYLERDLAREDSLPSKEETKGILV